MAIHSQQVLRALLIGVLLSMFSIPALQAQEGGETLESARQDIDQLFDLDLELLNGSKNDFLTTRHSPMGRAALEKIITELSDEKGMIDKSRMYHWLVVVERESVIEELVKKRFEEVIFFRLIQYYKIRFLLNNLSKLLYKFRRFLKTYNFIMFCKNFQNLF